MSKTVDGLYFVEDVVRGQWSSLARNQMIKTMAAADVQRHSQAVQIWLEQEPGSGGKESAEISVRELSGYCVNVERVTGSKEQRADCFAAQAEGHNVKLIKGSWNARYLEELTTFPRGRFKDQVDASSGAFNKLALSDAVRNLGALAFRRVKLPAPPW